MDCQNNDDSTFLVQTRKVNNCVLIGPYPGIIGSKSLNDFITTQDIIIKHYGRLFTFKGLLIFDGTSYFMKYVTNYFPFLPFKCISYMIDVAKETPLSLLSGNRCYNAKGI